MKENKIVNYSIIFIALVLLAIVLQTFQSVLRPLAIAALLFFLATPLARLSKQKNIPSWLTFAGLFAGVFLILSIVSSFVTVENFDLKQSLPQIEQKIAQRSGKVLALGSKFGFGLESITPAQLSKFATRLAKVGLKTARTIFSETMLALILLMFVIQSVPGLFSYVERRFGESEVERLKTTLLKIEGDIIAYFGTKTLMSVGTAIGTGAVLLMFKAKFISVSLFLIFILNFIPVIGSLVAVGLVLLLYIFTIGLSAQAAWLFLSLMVVQILFGSILEPKITGNRLDMSPILIILSLYLWGWIWGIIGMLISVPLTLFILIIIKHVGPAKMGRETITN